MCNFIINIFIKWKNNSKHIDVPEILREFQLTRKYCTEFNECVRKTVKEINELKRLKRLKRPKRLKLNKLLISNEEQEIGLEIRHEIEPYIEPDIDRKILVRWIEKGGSNSLKKKRI